METEHCLSVHSWPQTTKQGGFIKSVWDGMLVAFVTCVWWRVLVGVSEPLVVFVGTLSLIMIYIGNILAAKTFSCKRQCKARSLHTWAPGWKARSMWIILSPSQLLVQFCQRFKLKWNFNLNFSVMLPALRWNHTNKTIREIKTSISCSANHWLCIYTIQQ